MFGHIERNYGSATHDVHICVVVVAGMLHVLPDVMLQCICLFLYCTCFLYDVHVGIGQGHGTEDRAVGHRT